MNTTALVELRDKQSTDTICKLIYKKYGGTECYAKASDQFHVQSPFNQSLIAYECSRTNSGPHLYGLLDDVRIEEYIDKSEHLNPSDAFTDEIIDKVAQAYAKFHCMQIPIPKESIDILSEIKFESIDEMIVTFTQWINSGELDEKLIQQMNLHSFINFPFKDEINWIKKMKNKISQRIIFGIGDSQYLNRLVCRDGNNKCDRIVMIDYDLAFYMERGNDLAGHFISRMMKWDGEEHFISGYSLPSEEERDKFLSIYLQYFKEKCQNLSSLDTIENLTLEVDLHLVAYTIIILNFTGAMIPVFKACPSKCKHLAVLIQLHGELKDRFCMKYPHLV